MMKTNDSTKISDNRIGADKSEVGVETRNEETKVCIGCNETKIINKDNFWFRFEKPLARCKECTRKQKAESARKRRTEIKNATVTDQPATDQPVNVGKICKYCNVEQPADKFRPKRHKCIDCERKDGRKYRQTEHGKEKSREWKTNNQSRMTELQANWHQKNKEEIYKRRNNQYETDEVYRTRILNKSSTKNAYYKTNTYKYVDCLGCTAGLFVKWINFCLESSDDLSVDNNDEWHFDHVIPIGSFDFNNEDATEICYNWRNVMPIKGSDNLSKNKYIDYNQIYKHHQNLVEFHRINKLKFPEKYEKLYAKHLITAGNPLEL